MELTKNLVLLLLLYKSFRVHPNGSQEGVFFGCFFGVFFLPISNIGVSSIGVFLTKFENWCFFWVFFFYVFINWCFLIGCFLSNFQKLVFFFGCFFSAFFFPMKIKSVRFLNVFLFYFFGVFFWVFFLVESENWCFFLVFF